LAVHKAGIDAIAAAGASLLYLQRHGPDLHRIERFLAKLKALLAATGEPRFPFRAIDSTLASPMAAMACPEWLSAAPSSAVERSKPISLSIRW